jgi:type IV pilus assembly protein PilE
MKTKSHGFTLIELMIAVAIVGILASIAYPSYIGQVRKSKRADAKAALVSFANAMEIWKMQNGNSYLGAGTPTNTGAPKANVFPSVVPVSGGTPTYNLTIAAIPVPTASSYTLVATPVRPDPICGTLTINNTGATTPTTAGCW